MNDDRSPLPLAGEGWGEGKPVLPHKQTVLRLPPS